MMSFDCGQQGRIGACDGAGQCDLRLHAGDAVHGELVLALELAHLRGEVGIEQVTGGRIRPAAVQVLQALA